ncbi:PaaX family transcriptional regulator C-terminal domain-containing protein [Nocardioides sp. HM23]|uniref:PaaX family transcriptional regulator C-terminal domain-containing protein n=1 Tax=Nocardioides bizhenqiangii TaxID=3095076 RepID=UPI002ACA4B6D|nr:PaaX family transcriptional regulator C-terminal domain-containing protein [Nocardioides sp. HM23]MDZ5619543.1 PaaX family transcriptional regulator C-terminal domain-containing protein [Nocardioides sp. HM23]
MAVAVDLKPLPARSVVLSLLLGSHPDRMSPAQVTRAGEHFGIPASTLRVALTRAVAAGDLRRQDRDYVLGARLVARQRRQDEGVEDAETAWDGTWEMAVVVVSGRSGSERAALREKLTGARLAELREGVWTRPANLRRAPAYAGDPVLASFRARPDGDPVRLARELWNLRGWAADGRALLRRLARTKAPAPRLAVAAHVVRHLTADPLLPRELLPADWPGGELRTAYADYQTELRSLAIV